jgi:hypothetical protein
MDGNPKESGNYLVVPHSSRNPTYDPEYDVFFFEADGQVWTWDSISQDSVYAWTEFTNFIP